MAGSFGGTIKLTGESEYRKALSSIGSNLRVLNSELKMVASGYDKNDKSVSNLSRQNDVLNKKITEQKEKVATLSKALEQSKRETGESSNTTKKWQVELNNAKAELNRLGVQLDKNTKDMNEFDDATEAAGKSSLGLGDIIKANLISGAIMGGIKALATGLKTMAGALVSLGKEAVASYAEYEQLVGGIETLFGESSKTVQEYANNAYKNAGLSANAYMQQVTSFSASLLQGLGGDTEKTALYANRAIVDMSDNANKMGTSMDMIQNAYQGFAKQNYTMLDNLKLGYGGTKTEMQRLIKDASLMTDVQKELGVTVDGSSMSFDNIINSISVMQKHLGFTGTTAQEASNTIEGSTLAMKASWKNLVTGLADDNADFGSLVDNFVNSTVGAMTNLLPRISKVVGGIGKLIGGLGGALLENLPMLINTGKDLVKGIVGGVQSAIPTIIPILQELISQFITFISTNAQSFFDSGMKIIQDIGTGIEQNIPNFISKALDLISGFSEFLLENVPILVQNGMDFIRNLVQGLMDALPELIARVPEIISNFANAINNSAPIIIQEGLGLIWDIITGIIQAIPTLIANVPKIISAIVDVWSAFNWIDLGKNVVKFLGEGITFMKNYAKQSIETIKDTIVNFIKDLPSNLYNIGKDGIKGLGNAISSMLSFVTSKASSVATGIINKFKSLLSINTLKSIGKDLIKGLWNGISDMTGWILDKIGGFANSIVKNVKKFFGIHSPSKLFETEIGKNLALGLGNGFTGQMSNISKEMQNAIPTSFDISANVKNSNPIPTINPINDFKQALKGVRIVLNDREVGEFVLETVGGAF